MKSIYSHDLVSLDEWNDFDEPRACDRYGEEFYELTTARPLDHTGTLETEEQYRAVPVGTVIRGEDRIEFRRVTHGWQNLGHSSNQLAHDEISGLTA